MKQTIRSLLQKHLVDLGKFNTAWEGVNTIPKLPYQSVYLNVSTSDTGAISNKPHALDAGFLQVTLFYALGSGTKAIEDRATSIRNHFYGKSFLKDGIQVVIHTPPVIGGALTVDDKLAVPVTINFKAYEL